MSLYYITLCTITMDKLVSVTALKLYSMGSMGSVNGGLNGFVVREECLSSLYIILFINSRGAELRVRGDTIIQGPGCVTVYLCISAGMCHRI